MAPDTATKNGIEEVVDEPTYIGASADAARFEQRQHSISVIDAIKESKKPLMWCGYMFFLTITWGFEGMATGVVVSIPKFRQDFGTPFGGDYIIDANWQLAFLLTSLFAMMFGNFIAGLTVQRWGRRWTLCGAFLSTLAGVFLLYFCTTKGQFLGSKVLLGIPLGTYVTCATPYASEMAPLKARGGVAAGTNLGMAFGQLLVYGVLRETNHYTDDRSYKYLFASQWGFVGVGIVLLVFLPESPYWLISRGKEEAARTTLAKLYGSDYDIDGYMAFIRQSLRQEEDAIASEAGYMECFSKKNWKRTLVGCSVFFIGNSSGTAWVVGYMGYYFQLAGIKSSTAFDATVGIAGAMVIGNLCGWFLVDFFGRRGTMLYGAITLDVILIAIGTLSQFSGSGPIMGQIVFMALWGCAYQSTLGTAQWSIAAESPTSRVRAHALALGNITNTVLSCVWSVAMPYAINPDQGNLGGKIAFLFVGVLSVCIVFIFFFIPETKGRSFVEIDELWAREVPARKFASTTLTTIPDETGLEKGEVSHEHVA